MISMGWMISPFKVDDDQYGSKKRSSSSSFKFVNDHGHAISSSSDSVGVGLQILILHLSHPDSKVILKSTLKLRNQIPFPQSYSCFLTSCFLCNKNLSPRKDVYMYRGDQGFCSEECRNRQIYTDEMREIEISTEKMLASFRQSQNGGRCESRAVLRHRDNYRPISPTHPVIFS